MASLPSALRVGGYSIDTSTTSFPARHSGGVASLPARDRQRLYAGLKRLLASPPPRSLCELLIEAAERGYDRSELLDQLDRYGAIPPDVLRAVGGDTFPPRPLRIVP